MECTNKDVLLPITNQAARLRWAELETTRESSEGMLHDRRTAKPE